MNAHTPHSNTAVADVWFGWASFLDKPTEPFGTYVQGVPGLMDYVVNVDVPLGPDKQPIIDIYQRKARYAWTEVVVQALVCVQFPDRLLATLRMSVVQTFSPADKTPSTHCVHIALLRCCLVVHFAVWRW